MLIINAAVEQLCTIIDESLCSSNPKYLRMHHDDRLLIVTTLLAKELPEYVTITHHDLPSRHVMTALPKPDLFKLISHQPIDLPVRIIPFETHVPLKGIAPKLINKFMLAVVNIHRDRLEEIAARFAVEFDPICSRNAEVFGWDKQGIMHVVVIKRDPLGIDEPEGTNMISGVGKHRALNRSGRNAGRA